MCPLHQRFLYFSFPFSLVPSLSVLPLSVSVSFIPIRSVSGFLPTSMALALKPRGYSLVERPRARPRTELEETEKNKMGWLESREAAFFLRSNCTDVKRFLFRATGGITRGVNDPLFSLSVRRYLQQVEPRKNQPHSTEETLPIDNAQGHAFYNWNHSDQVCARWD